MKHLFLKKCFNPEFHKAYIQVCKENCTLAKKSRNYFQKLYQKYQELNFEEDNFLDGVQKQWYPRIWELYFTCELYNLGFNIECPKGNALDIKIKNKVGRIIWIECSTLSRGNNALKEFTDGEAHSLNDEEYIIRLTSTIKEKYQQIKKHIKSGIVGENDIVLIAINTGELLFTDIAQFDFPLVHKSLYGIGNIAYNFTTQQQINTYRTEITKKTSIYVETNLFTSKKYEIISGVIFSNWNTTEIGKKLKNDFELTHNLNARNKLEQGVFQIGIEYVPYVENGNGLFKKIHY